MSVNAIATPSAKGRSVGYWITTGLFCLLMTFSGFAYLTQPMMAQAFQHLGFPPYFRVELAIWKLVGVVVLLAPVPAKLKEWAYAGFGITLVSAIVAHSSVDGPQTAVVPFVALLVWAASYGLYTKRQG